MVAETGRIALLLLVLANSRAWAGPNLIKAAVEEPVVPELMGGCSLRCSVRWTVELLPAAGHKAQPVKPLNDEAAETAWVLDGTGGVGARLRLSFPKKLPAEMEGEIPLYGLDMINGYWRSEELWARHGRVKKVRLFYNDKPLRDVLFADSRRWQRVIVPDLMLRSGDSLTLEILEIHPGEKPGVALSELVLQGAH